MKPQVLESNPSILALLDSFEQDWQTGNPTRIEDVVSEAASLGLDSQSRVNLLRELLAIDLWHRWQTPCDDPASQLFGVPVRPLLEDYAEQFPELGLVDQMPLTLACEEYRARRNSGEEVAHPQFLNRFDPQIRSRLEEQMNRIALECSSSSAEIDSPSDPAQATTLTCARPRQFYCEGQRIEHFKLQRQLGSGAFGAVWQAHDEKLNRKVAIKLPRQVDLSPEDADYFLSEARSAARLTHPHIVAVYEAGFCDGLPYIVSELVDGDTLSRRISDFSQRGAVLLCAKISEALHHAHESGVVHRDIKPGNIMIDAEGAPRIMDFGLARLAGVAHTITADGAVFGTPAYMAPEQAKGQGRQTDARTDVYALGGVLYQLLSGELPFRGSTAELLLQVANDESPSPRKFVRRLPRDLETICLKCLAKSPSRRYQTALELAEDLRRWLRRSPIKARPIGPLQRLGKLVAAHPVPAGLLSALFLVLITLTGVLTLWGVHSAALIQRLQRSRVQSAVSAKQAEQDLYVVSVQTAFEAWSKGDFAQAASRLERAAPDRLTHTTAGFEYQLLRQWINKSKHSGADLYLGAETPLVRDMAFLNNDEFVTVGQGAAQSPQESSSLNDDSQPVSELVAWSLTGQTPQAMQRSESYSDLIVSPAGNTLAISVGAAHKPSRIELLDVATDKRRVIFTDEVGAAHSLAFVGAAWLAIGSGLPLDATEGVRHAYGGCVKLLSLERGIALGEFDLPGRIVADIAASPNGRWLAVGLYDGGELLLLEIDQTGKLSLDRTITLPQKKEGVSAVCFLDDSRVAYATFVADELAEPAEVFLWDLEKPQPIKLGGHTQAVSSLCAISHDTLVSGGVDGHLKKWDTQQPGKVQSRNLGRPIWSLGHHSTAGVAFAVVSEPGARFFLTKIPSQEPGAQVEFPDIPTSGVICAMSNDGASVFVADSMRGSLHKFDSETGAPMPVGTSAPMRVQQEALCSVAAVAHPDEKLVVTGNESGLLTLWDPQSMTPVDTRNLSGGPINHIATGRFGRLFVTASRGQSGSSNREQGELLLWNARLRPNQLTLVRKLKKHSHGFKAVAFSPTSRTLASIVAGNSAQEADRLLLFDYSSGAEIGALRNPNHSMQKINDIAYSRDGQRIVCVGADSTPVIQIRDAKSGELILRRETSRAPLAVTHSPDGRTIATSSGSKVELWEATSAEPLMTLDAPLERVEKLCFGENNRVLFACGVGTNYGQGICSWRLID